MATLMNAILSQFDSDTLDQLSNQLGMNQQTTGNAIAAAVPLLLSALSRNASKDDGRESLYNALSNDHDGGILNDLTGFLGDANSGPGLGILGHVFGASQNGVVNALSRATGMDASSMERLLVTLAPIVMGFLGRTRQQQAMGPSGLAGLLGGETEYAQQAAPSLMGAVSRFLNQNGNGSVVDELAGILSGMLSRR